MSVLQKLKRKKGKTNIPQKVNPLKQTGLDEDTKPPDARAKLQLQSSQLSIRETHDGDAGLTGDTDISQRDVVAGPVPDKQGPDKQGSKMSVQSREAWSDHGDPGGEEPSDAIIQSQGELVANESYAYVPYTYAKQCIANVVEDMRRMKHSHVNIVGEINKTYRAIEDETQAQFEAFVLGLRDQYEGKVKVFRQVIDVHRLELQQKQNYWDETLSIFSQKNKSLQNDIEILENDKIKALAEITTKLDYANDSIGKKQEEIEHLKIEIERLKQEQNSNVANVTPVAVTSNERHEPPQSKLESTDKTQEDRTSKDGAQVAQLRTRVVELEQLLQQASKHSSSERSTTLVAPPTVSTDQEDQIKNLEKEKKELEKDLKKVLKEQLRKKKTDSVDNEKFKRLLEITISEVLAIHRQVTEAGLLVENRLQEAKLQQGSCDTSKQGAQEAYNIWVMAWSQQHGREPTRNDIEGDASGRQLYQEVEMAVQDADSADLTVTALTMIHTGAVPRHLQAHISPAVSGGEKTADSSTDKIADLEQQISVLKEENESLSREKQELENRLAELESKDRSAAVIYDDKEDTSEQVRNLEQQVEEAERAMQDERSAHERSRKELRSLEQQLSKLTMDMENKQQEAEVKLDATVGRLQADIQNLNLKLKDVEERKAELEAAALANVPLDTAKEISALQARVAAVEKDRDSQASEKTLTEAANKELQAKIKILQKSGEKQLASSSNYETQLNELRSEKEMEIKALQSQHEKRENERKKQEEKKVSNLERKIKQLETAAASSTTKSARPTTANVGDGKDKERLQSAKSEIADLKAKIKQLELELKAAAKLGADSAPEERDRKKQEKVLKELEKMYEAEKKKTEKNEANLKKKEDEINDLTKENKEKEEELKKLKTEMSSLGIMAKEGIENAKKVKSLEAEIKKATAENKTLQDNFNAERVLRKKYYNIVEDMKGKIRVYCRVRPMSKSELDRGNHSVCKAPDEYTISVQSERGPREYQFDQIFMPTSTQDKVFEDSNNLIQSAFDGYNVCIFAYGQTGSGKTFTIIGDKERNHPGIAPRAFDRIFELIDENKSKFSFKVSVYMLELYNDRLLDLFSKGHANEDKMEIKKDKKGMVVVQGAEVKNAKSAKDLYNLFEEGSKNRHVASTKMNAESSRSHLVIGIVIESTNKGTGQVVKGKLSLVDLAGSERASKTGATAEQLKEAMSINKSLSALGDVISALSSDQSFIPYRNNKLTMLMQDSLGGNAKTLMFVNVSPADYNTDETITSLTYASRVKLITNDASKNSDSKEIARLKNLIAKMKKGDKVDDDDV